MSIRELWSRLKLDLGPLRRSPAFRRLWLAQAVSFIGSEVGYVALSYQVYALTGSTLDVGLLALAQLVPLLTLTLVGGAFADVFDRRRLMLLQQSGMIVGAAIALANAALPHPQVWPCFLCTLVDACAFSFGIGAQGALLPRLVADDQLAAANNLNSLISSLGAVAGPALAGVIIGTAGLTTAYAIDTVTFFATLAAVWRLPPLKPAAEESRPSVRSVIDGFRYIRSQPVILGFMLVDTNAMIFGMPTALFPALATHRFHDPSLVGYLYSATSAGALAASALGGWANHVRRQGLVVTVAAAIWGAAIAAFGFADRLWLALLLLAIGGGADLVSAVLRGTMLLQLTPDSLRGRLNGIEFAQVAAAPSLGNLRAGALASVTSIRASVVSGGVACVAGCALLALAFPALIRYDSRAREAAPA
ncbi:MAG: MFS transporter [Gaiellaceae bacterium]|jgi:MFS family permease